jgi:hypothetical protein
MSYVDGQRRYYEQPLTAGSAGENADLRRMPVTGANEIPADVPRQNLQPASEP